MRQINSTGLEFIKRHEGYVPHVYLCPANYLTIGYGHLCLEGDYYLGGKKLSELYNFDSEELKKFKISYLEAEEILKNDLRKAEWSIVRLIKKPLSDNQFAALVSFTFNLGGGALQRSTLRQKLNRGEYEMAANEFRRWVWSNGRRSKILIRRRNEEKVLFLTK
jgi:lysozyme